MTPRQHPVHPERALLTPTWLGALALLVANDHWLKGSGLLPGALTGKLSDFAGMLVAPVLLATLLRVRSARGLLGCHLAVAGVFAGIQLSSDFAALWSAAMGLLGHPWVITCDPTDLIALPCLLLSWRLLVPAMDPERPALLGLQRSAVAAASVFGLWATVATSDDGDYDSDTFCGSCDGDDWDDTGDGDGSWEEVFGQVYVHNPNSFAISLHIRPLRPEVELNCQAIATDPGRLLPDHAFGSAVHWELPPTTNVAVTIPSACGAVKIAGEGIPEQLIFSPEFPGERWFPGSHESIAELWNRGMAIRMDEAGGQWVGGEPWRFTPKSESLPQPEECMPAAGERRLDWSEIPSATTVEVVSMAAGLDGCHQLDLQTWVGENPGSLFTWYLCAPEASIRFELGEFYRITSSARTVEAQLADPVLHVPQVDDLGRALQTVRWRRATSHASWVAAETEVSVIERPACPWNVSAGCLEVSRKLDLRVEGVNVVPGEPAVHVDAEGIRHELILARARSLALTIGQCGSAQLPHDIDYALVLEPTN